VNREGPKTNAAAARCPDVRRWLQVFLDDEIADEQMVRRLAAHLDLCQNCRGEARTFSELKECLRKLQPPADEEALGRLHEFVQQLEAGNRPAQEQ
jgi:predicted anti-sigma-YlaC factor YlaD